MKPEDFRARLEVLFTEIERERPSRDEAKQRISRFIGHGTDDSDVFTQANRLGRDFLKRIYSKVEKPTGDKSEERSLDASNPANELDRLELQAPEWKPLEVGPLAELLEDVGRFCRRFLVLSNAKADVLALWAAHTHAIEAFEDTPFLAVTSAEPESGKTRVLEVLELLVRNPWKVVLPSEAVLYRKVSAGQPTLLLDEVDAVFGPKAGEHEGLRALLNAGNRRGTKVPRCVGRGEIRLEEFDVFCPRALAGIGKLPDTVASRSISLSLKRRAPGEMVEQLRRRDVEPEGHSLRDRLSAWAEGNVAALRVARPASPKSLRDRTADSCEPLLAIADAAGGEWPDRARLALVELCAGDKPEDDSLGIRLLRDCRSVFDARGVEKLTSAELCAALGGLEEAPWCELHKGRPLTVHGLAKKLNPYGILPGTIRLDNGTAKGYYRAAFGDAWSRYLPPTGSPIVTPSQPRYREAGEARSC